MSGFHIAGLKRKADDDDEADSLCRHRHGTSSTSFPGSEIDGLNLGPVDKRALVGLKFTPRAYEIDKSERVMTLRSGRVLRDASGTPFLCPSSSKRRRAPATSEKFNDREYQQRVSPFKDPSIGRISGAWHKSEEDIPVSARPSKVRKLADDKVTHKNEVPNQGKAPRVKQASRKAQVGRGLVLRAGASVNIGSSEEGRGVKKSRTRF